MLGGSDVSRVGPVGGYVDPGAGTAVLTMTLAAPSGVYAARRSNPGLADPGLEARTRRQVCYSHVCASP